MPKPKLILNKKFNRYESEKENYYLTNFGGSNDFSNEYEGVVKCKLGHGRGFSLIIPELLFLGKEFKQWFQPLSFTPNQVFKMDDEYGCQIFFDVSGETTVKIRFTNADFIRNLRDHSQLFHCRIFSVKNLPEHCSGSSCLTSDGDVLIDLFHHSQPAIIDLIKTSKLFKGSSWNIQGTKRVVNTHFIYFTWVDEIRKDGDLKAIAMSSDGLIDLRRDFAQIPEVLPPDWRTRFQKDVRTLKVYRENTSNRTAVIKIQVACDALSPQHLYEHLDERDVTYYQITNPYIHRISIDPNATVSFGPGDTIKNVGKILDYCIVGDACDLDGLAAPYDEEETDYIMKYEKTSTNFLQFWFDKGNSDLYSKKGFTKLEF